MTTYTLSRRELEELVQRAVLTERNGTVDTSFVHRASRARTLRRTVLRNYLETEGLVADRD